MDGYAVDTGDLPEPGGVLRVVGEMRAGRSPGDLRMGGGDTCRIFTGAVLPPGADAVVMVERTQEDGAAGTVRVDIRPEPGQHVRKQGSDLRAGETVLEPGVAIDPPEIAALASVGQTRLAVFERPTVHVLATGDEIVEPDRTPREHQVRNSNAPTVLAQLRELGLSGHDLGVSGDSAEDLDRRIERGLAGQMLIVTGGVSVGRYDLVEERLRRAGMRLLFHGVRIKPGKPILAGRRGSCLVLGLPGNPVSTYVGFALFAAPALRRMLGHRRFENVRMNALLGGRLRCKPGRLTFHLARISVERGRPVARPVSTTGSGDVLALARANGLVVTEPDADELPGGSEVEVWLFRDFHLR
jgi:molybdopterin molybdotransferase